MGIISCNINFLYNLWRFYWGQIGILSPELRKIVVYGRSNEIVVTAPTKLQQEFDAVFADRVAHQGLLKDFDEEFEASATAGTTNDLGRIPKSKDPFLASKSFQAFRYAILKQESQGTSFLPDGRPKILFEPHVFRRHTDGKFDKSHPHISHGYDPNNRYGSLTHQWDDFNLGTSKNPSQIRA